MQTFLPYSDFRESALALDKKRCWKQVVEAHQIIGALELRLAKYPESHIPWGNHPAVLMWEGHTTYLKYYFNIFLEVAKSIHNINTKYKPFDNVAKYVKIGGKFPQPWWLGNEDFHRAMRARLIEKDPNFYLPKFPQDQGFNGGKYFWPDMKTNTFKII